LEEEDEEEIDIEQLLLNGDLENEELFS